MYNHRAQNSFRIVNPRVLAILRAKCTQEKNDIFFWILQDLSFPTHFRLFKLDKNSLLYDILKFDENFFLTPPMRIFVRGVIFQVRVQSLNKHTEVSFCPILIIESALESWDPMKFKKISLILCASTRHKIGSELLTPMFWPFCVQNARKKNNTYFFEFYKTSAFQRTFDYLNWTKTHLCTIF